MAYRGDDLDLRTPQALTPTAAAYAAADPQDHGHGGRARTGYGRGPINVDDVVMACCNHAFDVASAHRATEVRIEHLLHAMTRVDGAAGLLEARGIRVAGLRRDSATIIASEIPIGLGSGQTRPRRSDDLEIVLRRASEIAARRGTAASPDDVIDALAEMPTDMPGIALIARHGPRGRERDRGHLREVAMRDPFPLPPLSRSGPATEVRLETATDWTRRGPAEPPRAARNDRADHTDRADRGDPADYGLGTRVDSIQNARIEQLEAALRALTAELSAERGAVSGLVQDLQRHLVGERDDTSRFRGGLDTRLSALERAVMDTRPGPGDDQGRVLDRIGAIEHALTQQTSELQRPWALLSERLQGLEQAVLDSRHTGRAFDATPLQERLGGIERALRDTTMEGNRGIAGVVDRLKQMERMVDSLTTTKAIDLTPVVNRLDIIEEAVLSPPTGDGTKLGEDVMARMRALEESLHAQRTVMQQATGAINADIKALASALTQQSAGTDRVQTVVVERLQAIATAFDRQRTDVVSGISERLGALATALEGRIQTATTGAASAANAALAERLTAVATALDARLQSTTQPITDRLGLIDGRVQATAQPIADKLGQMDARLQGVLAPMLERLSRIETALGANARRTDELSAQYAGELKEVHEALLKLNTNQHTLAGSIDQWRLDGVADIAVVANRLQTIETQTSKPSAMLEQLVTNVDNIGRATVARYHRRNRFWYWLFGTDDWLGASWPSQVAAVERERQALRSVATRTTPVVAAKPAGR